MATDGDGEREGHCAEAPDQSRAPFDSARVVTLGKAVDGGVQAFEARFQLQRQIQRIMP